MIERRPSAEPKGTVAGGKASAGWREASAGWREASAGWREASAEPKLTEKAEPRVTEKEERIELTLKEETEFRKLNTK